MSLIVFGNNAERYSGDLYSVSRIEEEEKSEIGRIANIKEYLYPNWEGDPFVFIPFQDSIYDLADLLEIAKFIATVKVNQD